MKLSENEREVLQEMVSVEMTFLQWAAVMAAIDDALSHSTQDLPVHKCLTRVKPILMQAIKNAAEAYDHNRGLR